MANIAEQTSLDESTLSIVMFSLRCEDTFASSRKSPAGQRKQAAPEQFGEHPTTNDEFTPSCGERFDQADAGHASPDESDLHSIQPQIRLQSSLEVRSIELGLTAGVHVFVLGFLFLWCTHHLNSFFRREVCLTKMNCPRASNNKQLESPWQRGEKTEW